MNKLRALPAGVLAAVIIGAAVLTGGVAYAVYKTVIEPLRVEQTQSVTEGDTHKTTFALKGCPSYEGVSQDEITTIANINSGIGSEEARNYVIARCEQSALVKYAHDAVAAKGVAPYDSSVLTTRLPIVMPIKGVDAVEVDVGLRRMTSATEFYKAGRRVDRSDIPAGSLIHVAYEKGSRPAEGAQPDGDVLAVILASVEMKYYEDQYELNGLLQRVPCFNNPSESCLSDLPGKTFYSALTVDTGPIPPGEERYAEAIRNKTYIQISGVVTRIDGSAYIFRTSTGRSVTFHLPDGELERERAPEHALPVVGTEIIITTIGSDRDVVSSGDLLSAYAPMIWD